MLRTLQHSHDPARLDSQMALPAPYTITFRSCRDFFIHTSRRTADVSSPGLFSEALTVRLEH
ncbi:hypothetical protein E2C01_064336 [Portunus trituberculatus]|uniref:Uncharacterized protein n=1 Tax=Portunus trituberculatus TaxID=210409 RepID=A0A5B7HMY5_PORTR|nr:hypothetical protein [Portunus trituberculatus]